MNELLELTLKSGATAAQVINAREIVVENGLAELCRDPRCENYGTSANCPPHTSGPAGFRELLPTFQQALFFKVEVPAESLLSEQRREFFRFLQETAARVEKTAVEKGFERARAFAGGSCKELFCRKLRTCSVLEGRACRCPESARPSMSGFGIDVSRLMNLAGWRLEWHTEDNMPDIGTVCGLVLID